MNANKVSADLQLVTTLSVLDGETLSASCKKPPGKNMFCTVAKATRLI